MTFSPAAFFTCVAKSYTILLFTFTYSYIFLCACFTKMDSHLSPPFTDWCTIRSTQFTALITGTYPANADLEQVSPHQLQSEFARAPIKGFSQVCPKRFGSCLQKARNNHYRIFTLPTGPTGPQGEVGPTGPQGEPGELTPAAAVADLPPTTVEFTAVVLKINELLASLRAAGLLEENPPEIQR